MAYYREATLEDCTELAPKMREQDKQEVWDSHNLLPLEALQKSLEASTECYSIIDDHDRVVGMFGLAYQGTAGVPWLLASDGLRKIAKQFIRHNREIVEGWLDRTPLLINYVSAENTTAINWLKWLGFTFIRLVPDFGVEKKPFYEFVRIRDV